MKISCKDENHFFKESRTHDGNCVMGEKTVKSGEKILK